MRWRALELVLGRSASCSRLDERIETQPWGERCFYAADPFGNKLCFVDRTTVFTGGGPGANCATRGGRG